MIGKIVTGKSFGGAVRYLLGKEPGKAYILTSGGVELTSRQALIGSFEFQRRARPDVERVGGHISLSFHPDDDPRMSNQLMGPAPMSNGLSVISPYRSTPTMTRGCRTS